LCEALAAKASLAGKGEEATQATNALRAFEALANTCIVVAEPYLVAQLEVMLAAANNKIKSVSDAAEAAVRALSSKMSANAVRSVLPKLFVASEGGVGFKTRILALQTIASFGEHAPEQLGFALPLVVPVVTNSMAEAKREVVQAAIEAMTSAWYKHTHINTHTYKFTHTHQHTPTYTRNIPPPTQHPPAPPPQKKNYPAM